MSLEKIMEHIIQPALDRAGDLIPYFEVPKEPSRLILFGLPGAVLDSLNLVSFVFILEEEVERATGVQIKITTQDVIETETPPFSSLGNLEQFLSRKIKEAA